MISETSQQRIIRLQNAVHAILEHNPADSFSNLIENHIDLFMEFRLIYSTNNLDAEFSHSSLREIEQHCPTLKKFFYGTGLLFYSDEHYKNTKLKGHITIPLDYSLSLDSNAAERFRIWEKGGSLGSEQDRFEGLVRFIKEGKNEGFNFDYSFFVLENLTESMKPENLRPFETTRALKRFDFLYYNKSTFDILNPIFEETKEQAGKRAIEALYAFQSSEEIQELLLRRQGLYLILLKSVLLREQKSLNLSEQLNILIEFSLDSLGAFAKMELYFAWKLLKYGKDLRFFDAISQFGQKSLKKIRGMSWDLFSMRYQETLASKSDRGDFYVPFFASFDNRFLELAKVCPVRAVIIDDRDQRTMTVYLDEVEFMTDIDQSMTSQLYQRLQNPEEKIKRCSHKPSKEQLNENITKLEAELSKYC